VEMNVTVDNDMYKVDRRRSDGVILVMEGDMGWLGHWDGNGKGKR